MQPLIHVFYMLVWITRPAQAFVKVAMILEPSSFSGFSFLREFGQTMITLPMMCYNPCFFDFSFLLTWDAAKQVGDEVKLTEVVSAGKSLLQSLFFWILISTYTDFAELNEK